jgi:hypothetical protein
VPHEQDRPDDEHDDDVGEHQETTVPTPHLVAALGKTHDRRNGIEGDRPSGIGHAIGGQHGFGIDAQVEQQRHEDRGEQRPLGDRARDQEVN